MICEIFAKQDAGVRNQGFLTINFLQEVSTKWDAGMNENPQEVFI